MSTTNTSIPAGVWVEVVSADSGQGSLTNSSSKVIEVAFSNSQPSLLGHEVLPGAGFNFRVTTEAMWVCCRKAEATVVVTLW